jgi:hypothetical protein
MRSESTEIRGAARSPYFLRYTSMHQAYVQVFASVCPSMQHVVADARTAAYDFYHWPCVNLNANGHA